MLGQRRFALVLPVLAVVVTSALWLSARAQYRRFLCPPAGICTVNQWALRWTDYVPPSLQVAGMLNVPVAFFAQPLYSLVHDPLEKRELIALLIGTVILWSYIGWQIDTRHLPARRKSTWHFLAATVGCVFSLLVLAQTIVMFHVGIFYKVIAVFWSLLMLRHFMFLPSKSLRVSELDTAPTGRSFPRISLTTIAVAWAAVLVAGAFAYDRSGAPLSPHAQILATCCALVLFTTIYAAFAHLFTSWRSLPLATDRRSHMVRAATDTSLVAAAFAAVAYILVRG